MTIYAIRDWDKHFENNRTRELKRMAWVPMPNRMDGDGYTELLDHPHGAAHFGAWCALVEVASRCDPRGTLLRDCSQEGAKPHTPASLARITRIPVEIWKEVLPRLVNIGWITTSEIPQEGAVLESQEGAYRTERNGTEKNGKENGACTEPENGPVSVPSILKGLELYETDKRLCERLTPKVLHAWGVAYPHSAADRQGPCVGGIQAEATQARPHSLPE